MKESKRVALVTGANRGLGFETCRQLAQLDLTVILSARDFTKGAKATTGRRGWACSTQR